MALNMSLYSPGPVQKLLFGMLYFLVVLLLMGLGLFWLWPEDEEDKNQIGPSSHIEHRSPEIHPSIQGPQAGDDVLPPSRNVTPNFQKSPLHQSKPLTRAKGQEVPEVLRPAAPKLGAASHRRVIVTGPTDLLIPFKGGELKLQLAHIAPPGDTQLCWLGGQQIACKAMAKTALRRFIRQRAISCDRLSDLETDDPEASSNTSSPDTSQANGADHAACYLGAGLAKREKGKSGPQIHDIGAWMVRSGWAIAQEGHYEEEVKAARSAKVGIHAQKSDITESEDLSATQAVSDLLEQMEPDLTLSAQPNADEEDPASLTLMAPQQPVTGQGTGAAREENGEVADRPR